MAVELVSSVTLVLCIFYVRSSTFFSLNLVKQAINYKNIIWNKLFENRILIIYHTVIWLIIIKYYFLCTLNCLIHLNKYVLFIFNINVFIGQWDNITV